MKSTYYLGNPLRGRQDRKYQLQYAPRNCISTESLRSVPIWTTSFELGSLIVSLLRLVHWLLDHWDFWVREHSLVIELFRRQRWWLFYLCWQPLSQAGESWLACLVSYPTQTARSPSVFWSAWQPGYDWHCFPSVGAGESCSTCCLGCYRRNPWPSILCLPPLLRALFWSNFYDNN